MVVDTQEEVLAGRNPCLCFGGMPLKSGQVRAVLCDRDPWFGTVAPAEGLKAVRRRWPAKPEPTLVLGALDRELLGLTQGKEEADLLNVSGVVYLSLDAATSEIEKAVAVLRGAILGRLSEEQGSRNRADFVNDLISANHYVDNDIHSLQVRLNSLREGSAEKAMMHLEGLAKGSPEYLNNKVLHFRVLDIPVFKEVHLGMIAILNCADDVDTMGVCLVDADQWWGKAHEAAKVGKSQSVLETLGKCLASLRRFSATADRIRASL